jgi:hypothetical protein
LIRPLEPDYTPRCAAPCRDLQSRDRNPASSLAFGSVFEPEGIHAIAYVGPRIARLDDDLRLAERVHQAPCPAATVGDRRRQSWIEAADRDDTDADAIQGARLLRKLRPDGLAEADETPASAQELVSSRAKRGDTADVKRAVQRSSSR